MKPTDNDNQGAVSILFTDWDALKPIKKAELAWEAERQMDPFRQSFLDTLLVLPFDKILDIFHYGFDHKSPRLMALAVQALPEKVLSDVSLASQLLLDMAEAIQDRRENPMSGSPSTAIVEYPLFYAMEKLRSGRHDCHKEAWKATVEDYEKNFLKLQKEGLNITEPGKCHNGYHAFVIAQAENLVEQGEHYEAAVTLLNAPYTTYNEHKDKIWEKHKSYGVKSITNGYKKLDQFQGIEFFEIGPQLIGKEKLLDILVNELTIPHWDVKIRPHEVYTSFENFDPTEIIEKLNEAASKSDNLESSLLCEFISDSFINDAFDSEILVSIAKLHVKYFLDLTSATYDPDFFKCVMNNKVAAQVYSSRHNIKEMFELTLATLPDNKKTLLDGQEKIFNSVMHVIKSKDKAIKSKDRDLAIVAATCLAMSGTDNPDILSRLDSRSINCLLDIMAKYEIKFDNKTMIKINAKSKTKLLEIDLGL